MKFSTDRIFGVIAAVVALTMIIVASDYTVAFYTDPLGARGLPLLAAVLLGIGGITLIIRPPKPRKIAPAAVEPLLRKGAMVTVGLLGYSAILPIAGFVTTTAVFVFALGRVFGGPIKRNAIMAVGYTVFLYLLFAFVLGLSLPIGSLFLRSG